MTGTTEQFSKILVNFGKMGLALCNSTNYCYFAMKNNAKERKNISDHFVSWTFVFQMCIF